MLRYAVLGCGFWSRYQIAGWRQAGGVRLVAVYNRTREKAEAVARKFGVPAVYDDAEKLLDRERLDFIDIITDVDTHARFVRMAAERRIPVICQKPMAPDYATAAGMVASCRQAGVKYLIHENWRWQAPIRAFKRALDSGGVGRPFRGRIQFSNSFPVFANQPFLRDLKRFILTDIGSHILDTARFLFGEVKNLTCRTARINPGIRGEDVATVMLGMESGATVNCEMSYASRLESERFPDTYILAECSRGSVELAPGYRVRVTGKGGTRSFVAAPPRYPWADRAYDVVHASIADCNRNLLGALRGRGRAETTGRDNLRTMELVYGSYESARKGQVYKVKRR
jgi:predicted dehydrogenase